MTIENICALEKIKQLKDNSQDIVFADPPYALGSTVLIGKDGKPYYKEAKDFMDVWTMPDEKFWEEFYVECMRVLKYGGRVLFFGIDRQLFLFQYYAVASGLEIKQSLYWYFISNFPKSTDLSKQIEKRLGVEREVVGIRLSEGGRSGNTNGIENFKKEIDITKPSSELGKKYDGLKYSISPLKQVLETVMVFQKPTKNKSVLDDVFAYEDGDDEISVSAWNIDGGRVPTTQEDKNMIDAKSSKNPIDNYNDKEYRKYGKFTENKASPSNELGRFPSQLLIDQECADRLDEQSGIRTSSKQAERTSDGFNKNSYGSGLGIKKGQSNGEFGDTGGASKILHKIGYLDEELDLLMYNSKVSTWEREYGCDGFEKQDKVYNGTCGERSKEMKGVEEKFTTAPTKNTHITLKPIKLIYQIAKLLKTPTPQKVFFPFSGAGSEVIGFEQAGFDKELFTCSEINPGNVAIANARIKAWENIDINNLESVKKHEAKKADEHQKQGVMNFE